MSSVAVGTTQRAWLRVLAVRVLASGRASPDARQAAGAVPEVAGGFVWQSAALRFRSSAVPRGGLASALHPRIPVYPKNQSPGRRYALRSLRLACRALMMRIVSLPSSNLRIVYTTSRIFPPNDSPSRFERASVVECSASSQSRASKSANTVAASSKLTSCFLRFCAAFFVSHENTFLYIH